MYRAPPAAKPKNMAQHPSSMKKASAAVLPPNLPSAAAVTARPTSELSSAVLLPERGIMISTISRHSVRSGSDLVPNGHAVHLSEANGDVVPFAQGSHTEIIERPMSEDRDLVPAGHATWARAPLMAPESTKSEPTKPDVRAEHVAVPLTAAYESPVHSRQPSELTSG